MRSLRLTHGGEDAPFPKYEKKHSRESNSKTAVSRYAAKKILAGYETFHRAWPKKSSLKLPNVYLDNLT